MFTYYLSEHRSCMKVEVDVLGSPSLISLMVSVDVNNIESHRLQLKGLVLASAVASEALASA